MENKKGTKPISDWFIIRESEVDSLEPLDSFEELFESSGSDISDLIDDTEVEQGNSLALHNALITEACDAAIANFVKRNQTPSTNVEPVAELSPRLASVKLTPSGESKGKRKLFEDSGIEQDETEDCSRTQVDNASGESTVGVSHGPVEVLQNSNKAGITHNKFKELFGVPFSELTRPYKSDKTTCVSWVVAVMQVAEEVIEAAKILLQQQCVFLQLISYGFDGLFLLEFKTAKCRNTVRNVFTTMLNVTGDQLLINPPKVKSTPVALFFWRHSLGNASYQHGQFPDWITHQTMISHQMGSTAENFQLTAMVQWAYDNDMTDEGSIAYNYAALGNEDANASAWLKSNNQAKYVRDCCYMVQLIKRQEMREMSMAGWIKKCCSKVTAEEGDWKTIGRFLKFQGVNIVAFLGALRLFLKSTPKKQCIVICGPPDTGKSMFCFSLIKFLCGKVISYANSQSHFWLQPLRDCKVALLDDATMPTWQYIDVYMRTALDGHPICIDAKHKNPTQVTIPPMFITSNINVLKEQSLLYLHSRVRVFEFPNKVPLDEYGDPMYTFTDVNWKFFFEKLTKQLDLTEDYGEPGVPFRFDPGGSAHNI